MYNWKLLTGVNAIYTEIIIKNNLIILKRYNNVTIILNIL